MCLLSIIFQVITIKQCNNAKPLLQAFQEYPHDHPHLVSPDEKGEKEQCMVCSQCALSDNHRIICHH